MDQRSRAWNPAPAPNPARSHLFVMPRLTITVVLLGTAVAAGGGPAAAQTGGAKVTRVPSVVACPRCTIKVQRVTVIGGGAHDTELNEPPLVIARDSRGRIYLGGQPNEPPQVFAPSGKGARRLARTGDGPGETRWPAIVAVGPGDTAYFSDRVQARLSVFSPDHKFVRSATFPRSIFAMLPLADGRIVLSGDVRDRDHIGYPLHFARADGRVLRSFGTDRPIRLPRHEPAFQTRRLASDGQGGLWSAYWTGRYRLEHWDSSGKLLTTIERDADWYPPYTQILAATPDRAPQAQLQGMAVDARGRIWTLLRRPAPRWRDGVSAAPRRVEGALAYRVDDRAWASVLEVIEPATGRLVASTVLDGLFDYVVGPGLIGAYREDASGIPRIELWRVELQGE